ncbi:MULTISPECIES: ABC transporter permease [unclassified Undibacterium]|uniref:ABC transporter permease n=1 Tax=unclassified Undibacterium TaxID=2630295 RepID=UPI002AC92604|nr:MULTISPECIES: ABC transporter permease [unclassified Undibacterium]MEB0140411.1 ABC transporter permease [Undibacterium sp. CCC2.1]MEB0171699.1 ABC transporter permease [Undibacterium sp. CCC1.1]MEB0177420.1 ABC transporter permease [Undibacterium sp. CCC3.4]MEB0215045.1 ABC transporter permease [Undibacterium sp. 5I2]WPX45108.1 ABC transporter permease [Undibacterium sp. CCC3.4]
MSAKRINLSSAMLAEALEALSHNGFRTSLSLLGVAIGIAAIMVVSSIATSGRTMIFSELETFGLRTFWVFRAKEAPSRLEKDVSGSGISTADYKALLNLADSAIEKLSPVVNSELAGASASKHGQSLKITLLGVNQDYAEINGDTLQSGRFIGPDDIRQRANVAVVGSEIVARLLDQADDAVGKHISINGDWYVVIGTLQAKSRDLISSIGAGKEETGARVLIPYSTQQKRLGDPDYVSFLQGQARSTEHSAAAIAQVIAQLDWRHKAAYRYNSESMASYIATANRILGGVTLIGIVAATVSLLVGGLAIMNIMTTSVIERTKEIGLRRALGATQSAIKTQFLLESILISLLGGAGGVLLGLAVVFVLAAVTALKMSVSLQGLLLAVGSSLLVGIASGYYPARTASKLIPVEALRYE